MVFYFTGTGNSLYIARRIDKDAVSIPQVMRGQERTFTDEAIGVVSPVYGHEMPAMVKDFIRQANFRTKYLFLILTYGNRHGGEAELALRFCRDCGKQPAYIHTLLMADNWLPAFDMEEEKQKDKNVEGQLAHILDDLKAQKHEISTVTDSDRAVHRQFLQSAGQMPADAWQHLIRVSSRCAGCGVCEKVCPSGSIHVENGRAVHVPGGCQTCLACVHACPEKAIGLTVPEKNPQARYRNPHVSLSEIIRANGRY